jgi:hypothetical protein
VDVMGLTLAGQAKAIGPLEIERFPKRKIQINLLLAVKNRYSAASVTKRMSLKWKLSGRSRESSAFRCVMTLGFRQPFLECNTLKRWVVRAKLRENPRTQFARSGNLNFREASTEIVTLRM